MVFGESSGIILLIVNRRLVFELIDKNRLIHRKGAKNAEILFFLVPWWQKI